MPELRESGIDVLGKIPWGSHFCNFYETRQDLLDTLVPFFKAGLESKEFCLWVVSNSGLITVEDAKKALRQAVPDFERDFLDKNIEILDESEWYLEDNEFNLEKVINAWHVKLNRALAFGYDGMRVSGDTFWLNEKIWKDFVAYEKQLNDSITDLPITLLCTYPLAKSGAAEILDVVHNHQFAIARRNGEWEVIETPEQILAKAEIKKLNEELEERVIERTRQLAKANNELRKSEQRYLSLFENMAEGVGYFQMLFKDGKLQDAIYLEVNPAWEKLTGLRNVIGRKITEVLPGILETNSEFLERSVRVALTGQPERFESYSDNLKKWLSTSAYCPKKEHVIVVLDDITERKLAEETLQQSYEEIRRLTEHLQKIREEERTSIAREIHDELGQQLTAIKMDVAWIDKKTPEETTDIKGKLKNIIALLDGSNQSIRRILSELRSRVLDDHGLLEAIEWLGRQFSEATGIPVKFTTPEKDIKVSEQMATSIFRVCQEAFTNITRHALAKNVSVLLSIFDETIMLIIQDDGIGFDTASVQNKKSFGILGMKERVLSLSGKFELVSSLGKGTKINVSLPYNKV
jgi:PAS domain S-box-containing protein